MVGGEKISVHWKFRWRESLQRALRYYEPAYLHISCTILI